MFFVLRRLSYDVRNVSSATENILLPEKQADFLNVLLDFNETSNIKMDQYTNLGMILHQNYVEGIIIIILCRE